MAWVEITGGSIAVSSVERPITFYHGQKVVATPGTEVPLATAATLLQDGYVEITALPTNTGLIFVGLQGVNASNGHVLSPDKTTVIRIDDLAKVYVDTNTAGHGVSFVAY